MDSSRLAQVTPDPVIDVQVVISLSGDVGIMHSGTRRAEAGLFVPRANSTAAKNMFAYEGAVLYNGLPMVLKSADNFIDFKRNCNSHF